MWSDDRCVLSLPSFFFADPTSLPAAMGRAAGQITATAPSFLVIDLRGNTGGDFLTTLPLINAISTARKLRDCVVLVDKFTFSAAIVFVALLKHRLGERLTVVGEEMGDGLRFFAEGGTITLPQSKAALRYSTAFHDWETGIAASTTPPEIIEQLVAAGPIEIDQYWTADPSDLDQADKVQDRFVR
jgi:hypothetical protein